MSWSVAPDRCGDESVEGGERVTNGGLDVGVAAGCVGLELGHEQRSIGEELHVGRAHRVERAVAVGLGDLAPVVAIGGVLERDPRPLEAVQDRRR